jgi:glycogen debranching enzyme
MTVTPLLLHKCQNESLRLLQRNLTPHGIMAASRTPAAEERHYTRVFGRDTGICALGMCLSGDASLLQGAVNGLHTLARHQADNGQIPKFVDTEKADSDFWYLGCIDATLWWLIAVEFVNKHAPEQRLAQRLQENIARALTWLSCQEHPRLFLLQQNEASDWADIMPRSGFVLYTNALWYHVKQRYQLPHASETKYHFNHLFYPYSRDTPDYRRLRLLTDYILNKSQDNGLYLSFVNFSFWGEEGDVLGNLLAILFGLADPVPAQHILQALDLAQIDAPYPVRATVRPIRQDDRLWREYMHRHQQNLEHQYHNGGSWPFIGGFWVATLAALGEKTRAAQALERLAHVNSLNHWQFNEWFHGETGEPRGMPGQSWSAAMFLLAQQSLKKTIF